MVTFRCPAKLWERVKLEAIRRKTSMQQICVDALMASLSGKPRNKPL